jgi:hypothetical protein
MEVQRTSWFMLILTRRNIGYQKQAFLDLMVNTLGFGRRIVKNTMLCIKFL